MTEQSLSNVVKGWKDRSIPLAFLKHKRNMLA